MPASANPPAGCRPECPGCRYRDLSASQSLEAKLSWARTKLEPWLDRLQPARFDSQDWHYRDRARLRAEYDGGWRFGLRRQDEFIAIPDCPLHTARVNRLMAGLAALPRQLPLAYLIVNGAQATLVSRGAHPLVVAEAVLAETRIDGLWLHLHPAAGKRMFGKGEWRLLWGHPRSRDERGLLYGPTAFLQVRPQLHQQSIMEAADFLQAGPDTQVLDLYCGLGHSLRAWLESGARTIGVELGGETVELATQNAPGATVLRGKAEHRLPQLEEWCKPGIRLAYLNPPRTGLEAPVLAWLFERARPQRLAYLSCSPGTLRRDLEQLEQGG
ncbi:MAG: class I SAM-dependent RNA methyltransferase, partial [Candidatus Eremiobacteraeota bacterium]|nr:class I SAM-dependent RNA methyltransferase [Candidatus Eremiobacteraeota bacterium]